MTTTRNNTVTLTLQGPPVHEPHGVDAAFISRLLPALADLVQSLCEDPEDDTPQSPTLPMLLARLNPRTSTLLIQEKDTTTTLGLSALHLLVESLLEDDQEDVIETVNGITDDAFKLLKKFLGLTASAETCFAVHHDGQVTEMDDVDQIKAALKLLRNLRKSETLEEGLTVTFRGYLPEQRRAEFTRDGDTAIQTARVNPRAKGADDIIQRIQEPRKVSLVTRQTDGGNPSTTITAVE